MQKKKAPLTGGNVKPTYKEKGRVYKGLIDGDCSGTKSKQPQQSSVDIEVTRANDSIYGNIREAIREENDLTREDRMWISHYFGNYTNQYTYPDGWTVSKVLLPDSAARYGAGYHKVAIVASTAETEDGVREAIRRGIEVKAKFEHKKAHITTETIIVLSHNISFALANKLRVLMRTEHREVFIYSVKNAIGVAKSALKKFANLFAIRAQKIGNLPKLSESMQGLVEILSKRAKKLFSRVAQLAKALTMTVAPKKELREARNKAWKWLQSARKWGVSVWIGKEDWDDIDTVYDKISTAAQLQGIDLFEIEQLEFKEEAKRRLNQLTPG